VAAAQVTHDVDRYEILCPLGQGGFGSVYLARHRMTGREVALKISDPQGDPELQARALNEARIAATWRHPSLVDIYDCGTLADGRIFVAMERVEGRSLESILESEGRITTERAVNLAAQVLSALELVHARGVVHRDIKPSNLLVRREHDGVERVVVIDFGISKVLDSSRSISQPATMAGAILGTPGYMPPEQLDARTVDHRADLYAVGAVLFRALSGKVLFDSQTLAEWFVAVTQAPTPPLATVAPWVSAGVCAVVDRAVARDRDARPQSAAIMREWLEAAMRGAPSLSQPPATAKLAAAPAQQPMAPSSVSSYAQTAYAPSVNVAPQQHGAAVAAPSPPPVAYAQPSSSMSAPVALPQQTRASSVAPDNRAKTQAVVVIASAAIATSAVFLSIARPWESDPPEDVSTITALAPGHRAVLAAQATNAVSAPLAPTTQQAQPTQAQPTQAQPTQAQPQPAQPTQAQPQPAQPAQAQPTQAQPTPAQPQSPANGLIAALTGMPAAREETESTDVALLRSPSGRLRFVQARPVGAVEMSEAIDFVRRAMPSIESCHGGDRAARASITMMFRPAMAPSFSQPASTGGALARCVEMAIETSNPSLRNGTRSSGILADAEFEWRASAADPR
jgi:serine/threonine protein kinase